MDAILLGQNCQNDHFSSPHPARRHMGLLCTQRCGEVIGANEILAITHVPRSRVNPPPPQPIVHISYLQAAHYDPWLPFIVRQPLEAVRKYHVMKSDCSRRKSTVNSDGQRQSNKRHYAAVNVVTKKEQNPYIS